MSGVLLIFFVMAINRLYNNMDWLQILIAPKVYLVEYVAGLAK